MQERTRAALAVIDSSTIDQGVRARRSSSPAIPAGLFLAALVAALLVAPRAPLYWDTFGYVTQAFTGDVGGLGLGRPIFTFANQLITRIWLAAGASPWLVEPVLRGWWTMVSCLTAPLTWRLALAVGCTHRAAFLAGAAVAFSPAFAHAGGAVLTDGAAATLFVAACVAALQTSAAGPVASGVLAGLAVGTREQSVLNAAVFALLAFSLPTQRRVRFALLFAAAFLAAVLAPLAVVLLTQPGYLATVGTWLDGMRHDRALKSFGWSDVAIFSGWVLSFGPAVVVAAVIALVTRHRILLRPGTGWFALVVPSLGQLLMTGMFLGIGYSPRFLMTPFPVAIALPGAIVLDAWIGRSRARVGVVAAALTVPILIAAPILRERSAGREAIVREWPARISNLPSRTVIVTGQPCPAVPLVRAVIAHDPARTASVPDWQTVCPGWAWPKDLPATLDRLSNEGRLLAIDLRPGVWIGEEQQHARAEVERYLERRGVTAARSDPGILVWR